MKVFLLSVMFAFTSFFGIRPKNIVNVAITTPTTSPTPTIVTEKIIETVIPTINFVVTLKPTQVKPKSTINGEVLNKFFSVTDQSQISNILNNKDQLSRYETEYYQKYKTLPIPRLAVDLKKLYGMPSKNGMVLCNGSQLKSIYDEIENTEKDDIYQKMDDDCHHNPSKQETKICQDWRRVNDQTRPTKKAQTEQQTLDEQIESYTKKLYENTQLYDKLVEKYCKQ